MNKKWKPKRITVFTGHFGSGKTELAVNYALWLKKQGKEVTVIDFDLVNPYFRTKDAEGLFRKNGIRLIASPYANTNLENPALPAEIYAAFADKERYFIFDAGGDDDGAIPLGSFYHSFQKEECDVFFVLNTKRMLTQSVDEAYEIFQAIEAVSRLKITAILHNTHLKELTEPAMIIEGQEIAEELSRKTNCEILWISGENEVLDKLPSCYAPLFFPIRLYIKTDFI